MENRCSVTQGETRDEDTFLYWSDIRLNVLNRLGERFRCIMSVDLIDAMWHRINIFK